MRRVTVVLEPAERNWAAYSPDVPGCIATGDTPEQALSNFQTGLVLHDAVEADAHKDTHKKTVVPFARR